MVEGSIEWLGRDVEKMGVLFLFTIFATMPMASPRVDGASGGVALLWW